MRKLAFVFAAFFSMLSSVNGQPLNAPKPVAAQDFKVKIKIFSTSAKPMSVAELIVREGVAYQFLSDNSDEILIINWSKGTITMLDLERQMKTVVTAKMLDDFTNETYRQLNQTLKTQAGSASRGARVAAEIARPLIDPNFRETYDEQKKTLLLDNRSVHIEAKGETETDDHRQQALASCLVALTELGSMRDPTLIPPFTRLETIKLLVLKHKLRPTEISFVYRLMGPPRKLRWTYEFTPTLSDRETEAITRIDALLKITKQVSWTTFEPQEEG